jgi:pimeloyl-ACP methyl ester carboxylesterase
LSQHGRIGTPDPDGRATPQLMTPAFWQSGQRLRLLEQEIAVDCPVRLIHGDADADVPFDTASRTMRQLRSADVQLKLIKGGGHRLSEPHELAAILSTVDELLGD